MKNEPTVDKWEDRLDKMVHLDPELEGRGGICWTKGELREFINNLLNHSVQEAKAERDREWIKELKPTGIGNSLYIMPSSYLLASLKQEEV